ncbi:MAG: hypothetical protein R3E18_09250 [Sphingomonadaceae bacterium]
MDLLNIGENAPDLLPSAYEKCYQIEQPDLILALRSRLAGETVISPEDAAKCLIALYAWQNVRGVEAPTDETGQATMRNINDLAGIFGFDTTPSAVREVSAIMQRRNWITTDWGPSHLPDAKSDDVDYAYIDPGGFEAGIGLVASVVDEIDFKSRLLAPASDRVVDLSHNQNAVSQAVEKIDEAIVAIGSSNTLAPEEKELWTGLIQQGKEWLRRPTAYVAGLSALLLKPLYDAYSSVLEESAKPVIQAAFEAVKALIGL